MRLRNLKRFLATWIKAFLFRLGKSTASYREEVPATIINGGNRRSEMTTAINPGKRNGPVNESNEKILSKRSVDRFEGIANSVPMKRNTNEGLLDHFEAAVRRKASLHATRRGFSYLLSAFLSSQRRQLVVFSALEHPDDHAPAWIGKSALGDEMREFLRQRKQTKYLQ